jgi:outer membrane protein OmpA-like peptidoglycan-associated protein
VHLVGHADARGAGAYNTALGLRRARAAATALRRSVDRVAPGLSRRLRFETASIGAARPAFPNTTEVGRARNRRVEVFLLH